METEFKEKEKQVKLEHDREILELKQELFAQSVKVNTAYIILVQWSLRLTTFHYYKGHPLNKGHLSRSQMLTVLDTFLTFKQGQPPCRGQNGWSKCPVLCNNAALSPYAAEGS